MVELLRLSLNRGFGNDAEEELSHTMDALAIFNCFEAAFWISIGCFVWWNSRLSSQYHRLGLFSTISFVLFGISDIFEVFTGAWYRPLSLLLFKAACVIALVSCGVTYRLMPRRR